MPDYSELHRTADLVRRPVPENVTADRRLHALKAAVAALIICTGVAALFPPPARLDSKPVSTAENGALFQLTNQDRASNGVPSVVDNPTLDSIAEASPYNACGLSVAGRSQDMINRNYFSHQIPPCNVYVFVMMQEARVNYRSAGENIGWESYAPDPASYVNTAFMNSPDHRSNILNGAYTSLGVGSASAASWMGKANVTMFSEEFAQLGNVAPPINLATLPPPQPIVRNTPAPLTPPLPAISTGPPPAQSLPSPTVPPQPGVGNSPLIWASNGLLSDSVESILESYLVS